MTVDHDLPNALRERFGFSDFRAGQLEVIRSVLEGGDTLAVMPTGAGKSLCYQLPALLLDGVTLVVSPLVALMRDQVESLRRRGIEADALHSGQSDDQRDAAVRRLGAGRSRIVYVAPERFRSPRFREIIGKSRIALAVVDEAHCVSEWGHAFRPDYALLGQALTQLGAGRRLALTATASPDVRTDILQSLGFRGARVLVAGFDRPNLHLEVHALSTEAEKFDTTVAAVAGHSPSIIYCATRRQAGSIAKRLAAQGVRAGHYHAGMESRERDETQDAFLDGRLDVVTATNAFGLGIDKPDVRLVLHTELPRSLEAYYQEVGRAGRDGRSALAVLLYAPKDIFVQKRLIALSTPRPELVTHLWEKLARAARPLPQAELHRQPPGRTSPSDLYAALAFLESLGLVTRTSSAHLRIRLAPSVGTNDESAAGVIARSLALHGDRLTTSELARSLGCQRPGELRRTLDGLMGAGLVRSVETTNSGAAYAARPGVVLEREHLHRLRMRTARESARLEQMIRLASGRSCRRQGLLRALGETRVADRCGGCDVCTGHRLAAVRSRLPSLAALAAGLGRAPSIR